MAGGVRWRMLCPDAERCFARHRWQGASTMSVVTLARAILADETIEHCGERAAAYDRENRFFAEDFAELKAASYLLAAVPEEFGGLGLSLVDVCREQRRLAYRAP